MKRIIYILLTLTLVCCTKSNDNTPNETQTPIVIKTSTSQIASRGTLVTDDSQMENLGLYCASYGAGESWGDKGVGFNLMQNYRSTYDSDTDSWSCDQKWGNGYRYTFMGYSPYESTTDHISPRTTSDGNLAIDFEVRSHCSDQIDLTMAKPLKDIYRPFGGVVSLNFNHTLAAVTFELIGEVETVDYITIEGLSNKGTVSYSPENEIEWSALAPQSCDFSISREEHLEHNEYLLMIPQQITEATEFVIHLSGGTTKRLTTNQLLEAGKRYSFSIYIGANIAFGGVTVDKWLNGNDLMGDGGSDNSTEVYVASPRPADFTANCYMLHPKTDGQVYYIDVNSQINYFWDSSNGYVSDDYADNLITDEDIAKITNGDYSELSSEVLWKTTNEAISTRLITSGFTIKDNVSGLSSPDFTTDKCKLALKIYLGDTSMEGNAVVAVKKNGKILWSWHLWITDYNPDLIANENTPKQNQYIYTGSTSGAVHRYKDGISSVTEKKVLLWDTGGAYEDKFIMDRNLGALTDDDINAKKNILLYQFGRKDPFPYDHTGTIISADLMWDGVNDNFKTFADAIQQPTDFFYFGRYTDEHPVYFTNWCKMYSGDEYRWNDYYVLIDDFNNKSIFDPSPLGWCMIDEETCTDFSNSNFVNNGSARVYSPSGSSGVKINYPYSGLRDYYEKSVSRGWGDNGLIRCSKSNGVSNSYYMSYFKDQGFTVNQKLEKGAWSRSHGLATRVVQYKPQTK